MPDIHCPSCGESNEPERDICWACYGLLKAGPSKTTKISAGGKDYDRLADVPEDLRSKIKDSLRRSAQGEKGRIVVNGREYAKLEDVPEEFRAKLRAAMDQAAAGRVKVEPPWRSTYRFGPFTLKGHNGDVSEPLDPEPDAPAAPPDLFRIERDGAARRISWRWISFESMKGLFFAVVFGVPFAFTLYAYLHTSPGKPWPPQAVAMLVLFGLAPAAFAYTWLAYLVNRTTLTIDAARVTVRHGPLPCWGAKDILRSQIDRVSSERLTHASSNTSDGTPFEPRVTYRVTLLLKDGDTVLLVSGLLEPAQALFLERQLRSA